MNKQNSWTVELPRFGACDWRTQAKAIVERYYQTPEAERPQEISVSVSGGLGGAFADYIKARGLLAKEFYISASAGKVFLPS